MKREDVKIGEVYLCKVSGNVVAVRIVAEQLRGFRAVSLATGRDIIIKSAARLRERVVS